MSRSATTSPGTEGEMNLCSAHWDWAAGEDESGSVPVVWVDGGGDSGGGGEGIMIVHGITAHNFMSLRNCTIDELDGYNECCGKDVQQEDISYGFNHTPSPST